MPCIRIHCVSDAKFHGGFKIFIYICAMFSKIRFFFHISLIVSVLMSCTGYEKLLKSDNYSLKYIKAKEYYASEDYVKASTLLEQLAPVYRGTNKADSINFYQAYSSYYQNDYYTSGFYFKQLVSTYPNSVFVEESSYMVGYCHYMTSPRPTLDQENSVKAIESFERFLVEFPNSSWREKAENIIDELRNKLVEKSFISAKLYFDLELYKSSIIALNNSLLEYPDTKYREEIMFLILKSRFLLAERSIRSKMDERYQATIDDYYSFISEFPSSNYLREAEKFYDQASGKVKNTTEEEE
jgi:outer membrane protein assembly factor BamD